MTKASNDRGVIFDLDGVLIDTAEAHKQSWFDLAEQEGWSLTGEQFYQTFGMQNSQIIPTLCQSPCSPERIRELSEWKELRYRELIAGHLTLMEGAESLIKALRRAGFQIAIGTSTPKVNLEFMLDQTGSRELFDAFTTSEDVTRSKPAPDTFLKAAEKLGLPSACCVVFEDAIPGVQAAQAAGMAVIAVTTTRTEEELVPIGPDLIVNSLANVSVEDVSRLI